MLVTVWSCAAGLHMALFAPIFAQEHKGHASTPDIQGTWNLVSWERNGKDQKLPEVRFFITESHFYPHGASLPSDVAFAWWHYELERGDKPGVAIMNLDGSQGRDLVPGICKLEGATLRI